MWNDLTTRERYQIYKESKKSNPKASYSDIVRTYNDGGYVSNNQGTISQGSNAPERFGRYVSNTLGNAGTNLPFDLLRDVGMDIPVSDFTPTGYLNMLLGKTLKENSIDLLNNTADGITMEVAAGMLAKGVSKIVLPFNKYVIDPAIDSVKRKFTNNARKALNEKTIREAIDVPIESLPNYATPNYQGDQLQLTKDRLVNGGFNKIGIPNDEILLPDLEKLGMYDPTVGKLSYYDQIDNSYNLRPAVKLQNRRQALLDSQPFEYVNHSIEPGEAFYSPKHATYVNNMDYTKNASNPSVVTSHEFYHMVDDFKNRKSLTPKEDGGYYDQNLSNILWNYDKVDVPGFNDPYVTRNYFINNGGTELNARGAQIKNYFGITNSTDDITPEMWEYAKKNYVNDSKIDNNMTDMFRSVKDVPEYLKWLNPRISTVLPVISTIEDDE